jgi:hypothetical protein
MEQGTGLLWSKTASPRVRKFPGIAHPFVDVTDSPALTVQQRPSWDHGDYDSVTGVSKDEALSDAAAFLTALDESGLLAARSVSSGDDTTEEEK